MGMSSGKSILERRAAKGTGREDLLREKRLENGVQMELTERGSEVAHYAVGRLAMSGWRVVGVPEGSCGSVYRIIPLTVNVVKMWRAAFAEIEVRDSQLLADLFYLMQTHLLPETGKVFMPAREYPCRQCEDPNEGCGWV